MDQEAREGVSEAKRKVHKRTSVSSTGLRFEKMRMEVDMSDYIIGGILSMDCKDRRWQLTLFLSKSLNKTERNYEIHDKEILVVIRGLENWRHLLESTKFKFEV